MFSMYLNPVQSLLYNESPLLLLFSGKLRKRNIYVLEWYTHCFCNVISMLLASDGITFIQQTQCVLF